jgi:hypothetical protein
MVKYLEQKIEDVRQTETPRWGYTAQGYTATSGGPTSRLIRLEGEKRWRRLMVWCFSNVGTLFVRVRGEELVVRECDLPN